MTAIALDASVAVGWALREDEGAISAAFEAVRCDGAIVPGLWWFEVRNGLVIAERRGRSTPSLTDVFLAGLIDLRVVVDESPGESLLLTVARRHRLTVYDAAYLELALRRRLRLATLDRALAAAARAEAVEVIGDAG